MCIRDSAWAVRSLGGCRGGAAAAAQRAHLPLKRLHARGPPSPTSQAERPQAPLRAALRITFYM
eukprot:9343113-Alexandrium_andersonii.AAC.1